MKLVQTKLFIRKRYYLYFIISDNYCYILINSYKDAEDIAEGAEDIAEDFCRVLTNSLAIILPKGCRRQSKFSGDPSATILPNKTVLNFEDCTISLYLHESFEVFLDFLKYVILKSFF